MACAEAMALKPSYDKGKVVCFPQVRPVENVLSKCMHGNIPKQCLHTDEVGRKHAIIAMSLKLQEKYLQTFGERALFIHLAWADLLHLLQCVPKADLCCSYTVSAR
jgi:hypothetical protein